MSGIGTYGTPLPLHKMFWLWQIWPCCSRLPRQNPTIRYTGKAQKYQLPHKDTTIDLHLVIGIETGIFAVSIRTGIDLTGQDPTLAVTDTGVTVQVTHEGVTPGHATDPHTTACHAIETQADIAIDETPHTEEPHHTEVSPEITVDPDHVHHAETITQHHLDWLTAPTEQPGKTRIRTINKSPLMIHHLSITALMNIQQIPMMI